MLQKLAATHKGKVQSNFLVTWFLYHEVLACFTHPLRENPQQLDLILLLNGAASDKKLVRAPTQIPSPHMIRNSQCYYIRSSVLLDVR